MKGIFIAMFFVIICMTDVSGQFQSSNNFFISNGYPALEINESHPFKINKNLNLKIIAYYTRKNRKTYEYDSYGRLCRITQYYKHPQMRKVLLKIGYDSLGRINKTIEKSYTIKGCGSFPFYRKWGWLKDVGDFIYSYDEKQNLIIKVLHNGNLVDCETIYKMNINSDGNIDTVLRTGNCQINVTYYYKYDSLNRIIEETTCNDFEKRNYKYEYDGYGNVVLMTYTEFRELNGKESTKKTIYSYRYVYDKNRIWTKQKKFIDDEELGTLTREIQYKMP